MIPSLDKNKIVELEYDIVIVGGIKLSMPAILKDAKQLGLDEDKIVLDRTVCVPGFTLERYKILRHSQLSIIAPLCWGGIAYNLFGLPFLSPTINMFINEGYLDILDDPRRYFDYELRFLRTDFNSTLKINYPVFLLGGVKINMNHYPDVNQAREKWESRRLKINWFNLFVLMYTTNPKVLERFDRLPFGKKVCFVPFETDLPSGYCIPPKFVRGRDFWMAVNETAHNLVQCFDMWDMLLYGKKTPINQ